MGELSNFGFDRPKHAHWSRYIEQKLYIPSILFFTIRSYLIAQYWIVTQLQMESVGLTPPERQFAFTLTRHYKVHLYWDRDEIMPCYFAMIFYGNSNVDHVLSCQSQSGVPQIILSCYKALPQQKYKVWSHFPLIPQYNTPRQLMIWLKSVVPT